MVSALETIFTNTTRPRMCRGSVWIASIALSVPCPLASGANLATINADTSAPPVVTSGSAHGPLVMGRTGTPALDQRGGQVVAGHIAQQKMSGVAQRQIENDGAEAGDHTDDDAQQQPFVEVFEISDEAAQSTAALGDRCLLPPASPVTLAAAFEGTLEGIIGPQSGYIG